MSRGRPWTEAEDATMRDMRAAGATYSAIASKLGRSIRSIETRGLSLANGIRVRRWTPDEDATLRRMLEEGKGSADVAKALGRKQKAVQVRMSRLGLRVRPDVVGDLRRVATASIRQTKAARDGPLIEPIRQRTADGMAARAIARELGVTERVVRRIRQQYDIAVPKRAPKPKPAAAAIHGATPLGPRGWGKTGPQKAPEGVTYTVRAATYLGRFYSPVVRADIVERPDRAPVGNPKFYIVGDRRIPTEDMIALAEEHGW